MKKTKKILALVMSLIMMLSATSVGLVAHAATDASSTYRDNGLSLSALNDADKFELTDGQQASMILDYLDAFLGQANIAKQTFSIASVTLSIDLTSLNGVRKTLSAVNDAKGKISGMIGDLGDINLSMFSVARTSDGTNDTAFLNSVVNFLKDSANQDIVYKIVSKGLGTGSGQCNPGSIVNGFIPDNIKELTADIVGFLKETIFGSKDAKFDTEVSKLITDMLGNLDFAPLAEFTIDNNSTIYSLIDSALRSVVNWGLKQVKLGRNGDFGDSIKNIILKALPTFEKDYPFVNLDGIEKVTWDWSAHGMGTAFSTTNTKSWIVYQVNDMLGEIIKNVLPEFTVWKADNSTASLTTLDNNIAKLAKYVNEKINPNDPVLEEGKEYGTKVYAMVLANFIVKMFFPALNVSVDNIRAGNICVLAVQALNEFMSYYLPEYTLTDLYKKDGSNYALDAEGHTIVNSSVYTESKCQTVYKQQMARIAAHFISGYFPVKFTDTSNFDTVLKDAGSYFINDVAMGALGTVSNSESIYTAVDRILFSLNSSGTYVEGCTSGGANSGILPQGFLPAKYNTTKKVIDQFFNSINKLSVGGLLELLVPNTTNTDLAVKLLPNALTYTVIRVINKLFPGAYNNKTASLDTFITNANLATLLKTIMGKLDMNKHIKPGVKLANMLLGLSTTQKRGEADINLSKKVGEGSDAVYVEQEPVLFGTSTSLPGGYYISIKNTSHGINTGYRRNGSANRDHTYNLQVTSVKCENVSTVSLSRASATSIAAAGSSVAWSLSGTCPLNTTLRFLVTYQMSVETETGDRYGATQEARFYMYYGSRTTKELSSNSLRITVPTTVYASPDTVDEVLGMTRSTSSTNTWAATAETSVAPSTLTSKGYKISFNSPGTPAGTANEYYHMFSVASTVNKSNYSTLYGTYSITYTVQSKDNSAENPTNSGTASQTISLVLFDDKGLPALVNQYVGSDLQSGDYGNASLYTAFMNELCTAFSMVKNPTASNYTTFEAEAAKLEQAYEALVATRTVDKTADLEARVTEYADGKEATATTPKVVAKYKMFDYTPVSWARYSPTISAVKSDLTKGETSALKINEHLRFNETMANRLVLRTTVDGTPKNRALADMTTVYNTYKNMIDNSTATYTPGSKEAINTALEEAEKLLGGSDNKISTYAEARANLLAAANELIIQPLSIGALETQVDTFEETYDDNVTYSDEAWDAYQAALDKANDILNDPYQFIKDTSASEILKGNEKVQEFLQALKDAVETLKVSPFISELKPVADEKGNRTQVYEKKFMAGKYKYNLGDTKYLAVGCGLKGAEITGITSGDTASMGLTENKSRYTDKTYRTAIGSIKFVNSRGSNIGNTTRIADGAKLTINWAGGKSDEYSVLVTASLGATSVTSSRYASNMPTIGSYLPQFLDGTFADGQLPAVNIAIECDINADGIIDNTDLVLYKLYTHGKWDHNLY